MVAIFTGLGAGFAHGSANNLGALGLVGSSALGRAGEGVSVNGETGNLVLTQQDEFLAGLGLDASVARTYNSVGALNENGDGWRQSTDRRMNLTGTANATGSTVTQVLADGSTVLWSWNGSSYTSSDLAAEDQTLSYTTGTSTWIWRDNRGHLTETYKTSDSGYISTRADDDGNTLAFTYVSAGKLDKVTTQDGAYIQYTWSGTDITQAVTHYTDLVTSTAKTLTRTRYAYDAQHRLTSVTVDLSPEDNSVADGKIYTTTYTYVGTTNYIASITQSDGSSLAISYDGSNRVSQLLLTAATGDTRTTTLAYFSDHVEITDPRSLVTKVYFAISTSGFKGEVTKVIAPPATTGATGQTAQYAYDSAGRLTQITDALGKITSYTYDANGNVASITDPNSVVTTKSYDANNNLTLVSVTGSNASSGSTSLYTRNVYDVENHLRFVISAEGRVRENRYNANGTLQYTIDYPDSAYAPIAPPALPTEAQMATWAATAANNTSAEICKYTYDARGNIIQANHYGTSSGGVEATAEGYSQTAYVYDQAGRLLSQQGSGQNTVTYIYDGLGRLIASTDLNGGTTTIVFNDGADTTTVTTAVNFTTVSTYNKAGELQSVTSSGANTTTGAQSFVYDNNGNVRKVTDATGKTGYVLYDKAGRKIASVGQGGELTEYKYDADNRLIATAAYANTLSSTDMTTLLGAPAAEYEFGVNLTRPTAAAADIWSWIIYDPGGRVAETIAGDGGVIAYAHDAANRLVGTTAYANKLTSAQISTFIAISPTTVTLPTADASHDVVVRTFYDGDGNVVGALNGEGYLTQNIYDAAGRKVQTTAYANATTTTYRTTGTFAQNLGTITADSAKDISTRFVYDGQGLLRFTIDALRQVTELVYRTGASDIDANGQVRETISYAAALGTVADYRYATIKGAVAALANATNDHASYAVYDSAGRLAYSVDAVGGLIAYTYDSVGRVTKITAYATAYTSANGATTLAGISDSSWQSTVSTWIGTHGVSADRISRNYYDERGDVLFSADAEGYITGFVYDAEGRVTTQNRYPTALSLTDASTLPNVIAASKGTPATTTFSYDAFGRVSDVYDPLGAHTQKTYYANGAAQDVIEASGQGRDEAKTRTTYDQAGHVLAVTVGYGAAEAATTTYTYDGLGNVASISDGLAHVTSFTHDKAGHVLTKTDALSGVTTYLYDGFGNVVKTIDARSNASFAYYDQVNRVVLTVDAENYATKTIYTAFGEVSSLTRHVTKVSGAPLAGTQPTITTNAADATTTFVYDKLGRAIQTTDAVGASESAVYNAFGARSSSTNKLGATTTYAYDHRGLLTSQVDPVVVKRGDGATEATSLITTFAYDSRGNRTQMMEAAGLSEQRTTSYTYDLADRLVSQAGNAVAIAASATAALATVTPTSSYAYDRRGKVIQVTDPAGAKTLSWYDRLDRVIEQVGPLGTVTTYVYDAAGNVTEKRIYATQITPPADATGAAPVATGNYRATQYVYDSLNRVTQVKTPGIETASFTTAFTVTTATLTTTYQYDALGHLVKTTDARGNIVWNYYDKVGNRTTEIDAGGYRTDWTYDANGNVLSEHRYATPVTANLMRGGDTSLGAGVFAPTWGMGSVYPPAIETIDGAPAFTFRKNDGAIPGWDPTQAWGGSVGIINGDRPNGMFSVAAGESIAVTFEAKQLDAGPIQIWGQIQFFDANGAVVAYGSAAQFIASAWQQRQVSELAPAGAVYARVNFGSVRTDANTAASFAFALRNIQVAKAPTNATPAAVNLARGGDAKGGASALAPDWGSASGLYAVAVETVDGAPALTMRKTGGDIYGWSYSWMAWGGSARLTTGDRADQYFSVSGGQTVALGFDAKQLGSGAIQVWGQIVYFDANGNASGGNSYLIEADTWQHNQIFEVAPAGTVAAYVRFGSVRTDGATTASMDFAVRDIQLNLAPTGTTATPAWSAPLASSDDRVTTFSYDKMGRRLTEARSGVAVNNAAAPGNTTFADAKISYAYNALGEVTAKTEATGETTSYSYDSMGRMTSEAHAAFTDVNGNTVTPTLSYAYDGLGNLVRTVDSGAGGAVVAADRITTSTYDIAGRLLTNTDASGFVHTYRYDAAGRLTRDEYYRQKADGTTAHEAMGTDYDAEGRVTRQGVMVDTDSSANDVWSRAGAELDTVAMSYNAFGEIAQRGYFHDISGAQTTLYDESFAYDGAGRLWATTAGDGTTKYFMYDANGNQTLMVASAGTDIAGKANIDAVLDLWGATRANVGTTWISGVVATITRYDARNQAIEVKEPQREVNATTKYDLSTTRAYNAFGETAYEIDANGNRVDYTYNTMGRLFQTVSPSVQGVGENGLYITGYDGSFNPTATSATAVSFRPVEYKFYDAAGRLVGQRDGNGKLTQYTLLAGSGYGHAQALITQTKTADNATINTLYDIHGDARVVRDQLWVSGTTHADVQDFDAMGRLTELDHSGGLNDYYQYDGLGQRIYHWNNLLNPTNSLSSVDTEKSIYDQEGRLISQSQYGGDTITHAFAWDATIAAMGITFGGWTDTATYPIGVSFVESDDAFGRAVTTNDLGHHVSNLTYGKAGRVTTRTGGEDVNYAYFNTGRVASISGLMYGTPTGHINWETRAQSFGYDRNGNVVSEGITGQVRTWVWNAVDVAWDVTDTSYTYENATASFDGLGRLVSWSEAGNDLTAAASLSYLYDANSNIRRSLATYHALDGQGVAASGTTTQDYWFKYDALDRVVTSKGALSGGAIVRSSTGMDLMYNAGGQRIQSLITSGSTTRREDYSYNADNTLDRVYYASGTGTPAQGPQVADFDYDLMGRLTHQSDLDSAGALQYSRDVTYNDKSAVTADTTITLHTSTLYKAVSTYDYGAGSTYEMGQPNAITTVNYESTNGGASWTQKKTNSTTYTYAWYDGPITLSTAYKPDTSQSTTYTSTYSYNTLGGKPDLASVAIADGRPRTASFVTDAQGHVIKRDESDNSSNGDPHEIWYRFSGRQIGYVGNNGTYDVDYTTSDTDRTATAGTGAFQNGSTSATVYVDFDQSIAHIDSFYQGSLAGTYTAQGGETLSAVASQLWGDSALWYKLAEANGLASDAALDAGQVIHVPAGVMRASNTATTFQPYDPNAIAGNVSPTTPKPPKAKHCGVIGQIILAAIAVAVTLALRVPITNFISGLFAPAATTTATAAASVAGAASMGGIAGAEVAGGVAAGATAAAGAATVAGAGLGASIAGGALAAGAGSIASQVVGVATGIQDKFSWNAVALAAISGGVDAGVGKLMPTYGAVTKAVTGNVISQGVAMATGLQSRFSWSGVAASAVGASLDGKLGGADAYVKAAANLVAQAATKSLIDGDDFGDTIMAVLPDVIGQTIGNAIAGGISGNGDTTGSGDSIFDEIGHGLAALGDFLGFDGSFGYEGPRDGRSFSITNFADAVINAGDGLFSPASARAAANDAQPSWLDTVRGAMGDPNATYSENTDALNAQGSARLIPTMGEEPGDPMDGWIGGMFGDMLHYELSKPGFEAALARESDPQKRMRAADMRAMFARETYQFSDEEVDHVYTNEMQTRHGLVPFGSTDLSEMSFEHRAEHNISAGRNVAVFEYEDPHGRYRNADGVRVSRLALASDGRGVHAEDLLDQELRRLKVAPERVTRIYSDRQLCEDCVQITSRYERAKVTYAVNYSDRWSAAQRQDVTNALSRMISGYRRTEGTSSLWRWRVFRGEGRDQAPTQRSPTRPRTPEVEQPHLPFPRFRRPRG